MRRRLRGTTARSGLRLDNLSTFEAVLSFIVGWSPQLDRGRSRWRSWSAFLADWEKVRVEFFDAHPEHRDAARWPFAETLRVYVAEHGQEALDDPAFSIWDVKKHGRRQ